MTSMTHLTLTAPAALLDGLTPEHLAAYLVEKGWRLLDSLEGWDCDVYDSPGHKGHALIPHGADSRAPRITRLGVVRDVARVGDLTELEVLLDLRERAGLARWP